MFNLFKKPITVATHNGTFHADDVFSVATLSIWAEKEGKRIKLIRTRDPKVINQADIVLDIGDIYDPSKNRFDHHQQAGAGNHENGIPYASFGLIWKHYANKITNEESAKIIEKELVSPIDARDNGIDVSIPDPKYKVSEYTPKDMVSALRPTISSPQDWYKSFVKAYKIARQILEGEIRNAENQVEGNKKTKEEIKNQNNPEILILPKYIKWEKSASESANTKIVIYPSLRKDGWCLEVVRDNLEIYNSARILMPEKWRGVRDEDLAGISDIKDAMFCHRGGWLAGAKSKEGTIQMAKKALVEAN